MSILGGSVGLTHGVRVHGQPAALEIPPDSVGVVEMQPHATRPHLGQRPQDVPDAVLELDAQHVDAHGLGGSGDALVLSRVD